MKKKLNSKLKIVLGILMALLIVLVIVFVIKITKKEEPVQNNKEIVEPSKDEYLFRGSAVTDWENLLLDYYAKQLGQRPSLRESEFNNKGDLVVTIKNYENKQVVLIAVVTIDYDTGDMIDQDGKLIDFL